jgi:predicted HicB family RNase H-like nuclease
MGTAKIKIDKELHERALRCAQQLGYSSVEEFVAHLIERAVKEQESETEAVEERLRGLGYLE